MLVLFAERLKEILKENHMTRYKLSSLTGLSQTTLARYCNGQREPTFKNVCLIATALNIPVDYFNEYGDYFVNLFSSNSATVNKEELVISVPKGSFLHRRILGQNYIQNDQKNAKMGQKKA